MESTYLSEDDIGFVLFSTSSMDGPSVGLFVGVVTSSLIQLNSPSDSIPVKVNSSINPFLVTCCSIIICGNVK